MKSSKSIGSFLVLTLVLLALSASAAAPVFKGKFKFKDVKAPGATETDSYAINNAGAIAGDYVDTAGVQHGMILAGTKLTTADRSDCMTTPASTSIQFYGINSAGEAAGWCENTSKVQIGFTFAKGKFTDISIPGATLVNANGINDKGAVVGSYVDSSAAQHGFLLVGTKLTNLDPPSVTSGATAWSINNKGVITVYGFATTGYLSYTTADNGKTYTPFHAPKEAALGTAIHDINNSGDIVATYYYDTAGDRHGVLFRKKKFYSFDDPKGIGSTRGDGLNDTLGIVGRYGPSTSVGFFAQAK